MLYVVCCVCAAHKHWIKAISSLVHQAGATVLLTQDLMWDWLDGVLIVLLDLLAGLGC